METPTQQQAEYANFFLYLTTGNTKHVSKLFPRKRGVKKAQKVSSGQGRDLSKKPVKHRQPVHNAFMDIQAAHQRFVDEGYVRSHSHRIGHVAKVNGFRLMSNYQKEKPSLPQQPPYHREFTPADWQHANVGPQPVRN